MTASKLEIAHAITSIEEQSSGPSQSVPALANATGKLGHSVSIFSIGPSGRTQVDSHTQRRVQQDYSSVPLLNSLVFSNEFRHELMSHSSDIIHNHGLWRMPNLYAGHSATSKRVPLIISPRGMLSPQALRFSKLSKQVFNVYGQRQLLKSAAAFHATGQQECRDIRALGLTQPIAIIPNGVALPQPATKQAQRVRKNLLYLGRIHPIKGLETLLNAWQGAEAHHPDWDLRIVGSGDPTYETELKSLVQQNGSQRVTFTPALYGEQKAQAFRDADIYVLPSQSENFAMTIAEALSFGVPVIANHGAPWEGLRTHQCGWWIENSQTQLTETLNKALTSSPNKLQSMGQHGYNWMKRDFSWEQISEDMVDFYRWLIATQAGDKTPPPSYLQLD